MSSCRPALLICSLLLPSSLAAAPPSDLTLEEVRSAIEAAVASRPAVSVDYTVSYEPDEIVHGGPGEPSVVPWGPKEYRWAISGRRATVTAAYPDDRQTRMTIAFDGERGYKLHETNDEQASLYVTEAMDSRYTSTSSKPDVVLGRAIPISNLTLLEALNHDSARLIGVETLDGAPCTRIDVSGIPPRKGGPPLRLSVWIDPEHGHLSRRVSTRYESEDPRLTDVHFTWDTKEFFEVPNGATGNTAWFPKRVSYRQRSGRHDLVVTAAIIATDLPVNRFRPAAPPGTAVFNLAEGRTVPSYVGGIGSLDKEVARIAEQAATKSASPPSRSADATPNQELGWPILIFGGSSLVLASALVVWWRQRR